MKRVSITIMLVAGILVSAKAQERNLQYWRPNDQRGQNVYEASKEDTAAFDKMKVRIGGDFAIQFQSLNQSNSEGNLVELGSDFNLPTANLNVDVQLLDGVRMHLRTYLSSRNHTND